jgi:hypothetical protein
VSGEVGECGSAEVDASGGFYVVSDFFVVDPGEDDVAGDFEHGGEVTIEDPVASWDPVNEVQVGGRGLDDLLLRACVEAKAAGPVVVVAKDEAWGVIISEVMDALEFDWEPGVVVGCGVLGGSRHGV